MKLNKLLIFLLIFTIISSCTVEEFSDLNNAEVNTFEEGITRGDLQDLVVGLLYSSRVNLGIYLDDCGVIGREFYRFSGAEPRYTTDLLGGEKAILDDNTFYITNPWAARYRTVKNANLILGYIQNPNITGLFTDEELAATRGFVKTFIAHELLLNLNLTYENGIRIDVADESNLGPIVSKTEALTYIRKLLDESAIDLANGGDSFLFPLSDGFNNFGFNTPSAFIQVNKAIAARVAIYQKDPSGALNYLADSFLNLDNTAENFLDIGVYHNFSEAPNDIANPMFFSTEGLSSAAARIAHPSFVTDAEAMDKRLPILVEKLESAITQSNLSGNYAVTRYKSREDNIPLIKNEELILIYAEANITQNPSESVRALNIIRQSADLGPYTGGTGQAELTDEMLKQRRYSLYAEGHRWIDMRRYDRLNQLPIDRPEDNVWTMFPIPLTENP